MSENLVTYEVIQNIAHIGLNDSARLNVLSVELVKSLNTAIDNAETDPNVKAVLLFGHGRGFCVGGDLNEFYTLIKKTETDPITKWERIYNCNLPVIAAVHGYAVGGGLELLMMCDYRVASENTIFSQPELTLGFIPGCGATQRLPQKVGYGYAFDMMATGKKINTEHACKIGLIEAVTPDNNHISAAHNKALEWAQRERDELVNLKKSMRQDLSFERAMFYKMVCSKTAKAHIQKFLEKNQRS